MDTTQCPVSKPQWRFNRPHRVRLHSHKIHINDLYADKLSNKEFYLRAATEFSQTDRYEWAIRNNINLDFDFDDLMIDWFKQIRFFADLDDVQYTDYCLRFFDHHNEDWK